MESMTLSALNVYPIKSAVGIALSTAKVDARGLAGDRRWMVVDPNRSFLTQRTHPRLALVSVAIEHGGLSLIAPGMARLAVPTPPADAPPLRVRVWDDTCDAVSAGDEAAAWFSHLLGGLAELVYMPDLSHRPVEARATAPVAEVSFADSFPFLLISEESLADLNRRLEPPLPMNRFRPNLVVRGGEPYGEDHWQRIRIGSICFHVVAPCTRCAITTVDQRTGEPGREPLATLATYRRVGHAVVFGQNLVHDGDGLLRVGDEVVMLERT